MPFIINGKGFDTCTVPSINAMKAWRSEYSAIGVYIGGENMACDYGNLTGFMGKSGGGPGLDNFSYIRRSTGAWGIDSLYVSHVRRHRELLRLRRPAKIYCGLAYLQTAPYSTIWNQI